MAGSAGPAGLDRRRFLRAGAGVAATGVLGGVALSTLAGCGDAATTKTSSAADVELPDTIPFRGAKPDIPGTKSGVPAGFYNYPDPVRSVAEPPLSGGTITAMAGIFTPPPRGRAKNPAWRAVEKRLGATMDISSVSAGDYETKLSTTIAGGKLPDLLSYQGTGISNLPAFLASQCADLTPLLSGDKISQYKNLADIPKIFWKQCTVAGKLYFLPIPRNQTGGSGFYNATLFGKVGIDDTSKVANADDFLDALKELTRPGSNQWALGSTAFGTLPFHHIFGSPNVWRVHKGKLVRDYETDEYKAAVEYLVKVKKAGCFVPGSEAWTKSQMQSAFASGKVAMIYDGLPAYDGPTGYFASLPKVHKDNFAKPFIPFGATGGKPVTWLDNVVFGTVMIRKQSTDRVKQILSAADFFAAPFGTEEYLLLNYGVEGTDYTMDADHNPKLTDRGSGDVTVPWKYLAAPQQVVYGPTSKKYVDIVHDAYAKLIPLGVEDPCATLYSPTDGKKGATLLQEMGDTITSIIAGRKSMSAYDAAVKRWRDSGGDKIRDEYEQALAKDKGN